MPSPWPLITFSPERKWGSQRRDWSRRRQGKPRVVCLPGNKKLPSRSQGLLQNVLLCSKSPQDLAPYRPLLTGAAEQTEPWLFRLSCPEMRGAEVILTLQASRPRSRVRERGGRAGELVLVPSLRRNGLPGGPSNMPPASWLQLEPQGMLGSRVLAFTCSPQWGAEKGEGEWQVALRVNNGAHLANRAENGNSTNTCNRENCNEIRGAFWSRTRGGTSEPSGAPGPGALGSSSGLPAPASLQHRAQQLTPRLRRRAGPPEAPACVRGAFGQVVTTAGHRGV